MVKAFRVLELFRTRSQLGVRDCARQLQIPNPSAHRILATLASTGILNRTPSGKYEIGLRLFEIGALAPYRRMLYDSACFPLERVVDTTGLPAHLAVLDGDEALVLVKAHRAPHDRSRLRPGSRCPLHASALGKLLLAYSDDALINHVADRGLQRFTQFTVTEGWRLRKQLSVIRRDGRALEREELRPGLLSLAVPVRGDDGTVLAAISIIALSERSGSRMFSFEPILRQAAASIESSVADLRSTMMLPDGGGASYDVGV